MRVLLSALFVAAVSACGGGSDPSGLAGDPPDPDVVAMEDLVHVLVNAERTSNGVDPLTHDPALRAVARAHSEDMVRRDFFSHTNPDGLSPYDRLREASIDFGSAGENIAWNRGYADPADTAVTGWMNSDGHRRNILDDGFTHGGLGAARRETDGAWFFTQLFMRPSGGLVAFGWVVHEDAAPAAPDQGTSSWTVDG
jgi:uncharacterized protein YkwD